MGQSGRATAGFLGKNAPQQQRVYAARVERGWKRGFFFLLPVDVSALSLRRTHADSRFFVVDDEADEVRVVWRPEVLPGQRDGVTGCHVGHELEDVTFTCWKKKGREGPFKPTVGLHSGF